MTALGRQQAWRSTCCMTGVDGLAVWRPGPVRSSRPADIGDAHAGLRPQPECLTASSSDFAPRSVNPCRPGATFAAGRHSG